VYTQHLLCSTDTHNYKLASAPIGLQLNLADYTAALSTGWTSFLTADKDKVTTLQTMYKFPDGWAAYLPILSVTHIMHVLALLSVVG